MKVSFDKFELTKSSNDQKHPFFLSLGNDPFWKEELKSGETVEIGQALECDNSANFEVTIGYIADPGGPVQILPIFIYKERRGTKAEKFEGSGHQGVLHYTIELS